MFDSLKIAFGNRPRTRHVITGHHIQTPEQIVSLLSQVHRAHSLLNIRLPDSETSFSSALLGIYDEHGFVVFDELTPRAGHRLLLQSHQMRVSGRLDGVELHFKAQLLEAREKGGVAYYKVAMPKSIYYRQRRQDYRVPSHAANIRFHALRGRGINQVVRGHAHDLSRSGIGVLLEENVDLMQGEVLASCILNIPGTGEISFSLEVRYCATSRSGAATRMGGRFCEIEPESQRKIVQCINDLERAQARRLSGV